MWHVFLAAAIAHALYWYGGTAALPWSVSLLATGTLSCVFWWRSRRGAAKDLFTLLPLLIVGCVLLQLLPVPLAVLDVLSPARAAITKALWPVLPGTAWAPLSVAPAATAESLLTLVGGVVVFYLVRELSVRQAGSSWNMLLPLVVLGAAEAAWGLLTPGSPAHGTFVNRNHFAGLLAILIPIALGWALQQRARVMLAIPAMLFAAIILSASRGAFVAAVVSLALAGILAARGRMVPRRLLAAVAIVTLVVAIASSAYVYSRYAVRTEAAQRALASPYSVRALTPPTLLDTLSTGRWTIWKDTARLFFDYPLTGSGLGSFSGAFMRYQTSDVDSLYVFAHNDYLQALAEVGLLGVMPGALFVALLFRRSAWSRDPVANACAAAIAAAAVHSAVDFSLHLPVTFVILGWISAVAAGGVAHAEHLLPFPMRILSVALMGFSAAWATFDLGPRPGPADPALLADALRREPASPDRWLDVAEQASDLGQISLTRHSVSQALSLGPQLPVVLVRATDVLFAINDESSALSSARELLRRSSRQDGLLFGTFEDLDIPVARVLTLGIPADQRAPAAYIRFLFENAPPARAREGWDWALSTGRVDQQLAAACAHLWWDRGYREEALDLWTAHARTAEPGYRHIEWIQDGGFEREPAGGPFGWFQFAIPAPVFSRDADRPQSGAWCLRSDPGARAEGAVIFQGIALSPGRYRLSAYVRAAQANTRPIRFVVSSSGGRADIRLSWEPMASSSWTPLIEDLTVPDDAGLVRFALEALPRAGVAWVDSVRLERLAAKP